MAQLNLADFAVSEEARGVTFRRQGDATSSLHLETRRVRDLIDFLARHLRRSKERRAAFRVPVLSSAAVTSKLRAAGKSCTATPLNIGSGGALVDFLPTCLLLKRGDRVELILSILGQPTLVAATVLRVDCNRLALKFLDSYKGDALDPPTSITRVVKEVERHWLEGRPQRLFDDPTTC